MCHISAWPPNILLLGVLSSLPISDVLTFGATNHHFHRLTSDNTLWKRRLKDDFGLLPANVIDDVGWKLAYQRLSTPDVYVWGEHSDRRLGMNPRDLQTTLRGGVPYPVKLHIPGARRIVTLIAGGMSFYAIDIQGNVYLWGALRRGTTNPPPDGFYHWFKVAESPLRLELPHPVLQISCARLFSAALDVEGNIYNFLTWGRPSRLKTPLLDKSSPHTTPIQVECGWERFTAVLTEGGDVLVYWPARGRMGSASHFAEQRLDRLGEHTKAKVSPEDPRSIPCHIWDLDNVEPARLPAIPSDLPHLSGTGLSDSRLEEETKLVKLAGLDQFLLGLTNKGHVLRYNRLENETTHGHGHWEYLPYFSEVDRVAEHLVFTEGQLTPPRTMHITHIAAHFETFTAYSSGHNSIVLMYRMHTMNVDKPVLPSSLRPTIIPALQYRGVISVLLGDYHYGALTADGKLLTWGSFSSGALGLGDPAEIEAGQPGGFSTETQRAAMREQVKKEGYISADPPDVHEPTEVHFDHGPRGENRRKYVVAAAAGGWHTGALVVDLNPDENFY